jgi:hypothetical protein
MKRENLLLILLAAGGIVALVALSSGESSSKCPDGSCPDCNVCPLDQCPCPPDAKYYQVGVSQGVVMTLPPELRQKNWGGGSCVHASNVSLLRWQGQYEMADWWRQAYSGGEYGDRLVSRLEAAGLRYAYTDSGDEAFLRWCIRTRRGAGIFYKPSHSINCVGMDDQFVYLLDNNATNYPESTGDYEKVPIDEFWRRWKGYGGFAWTLIYTPHAPLGT